MNNGRIMAEEYFPRTIIGLIESVQKSISVQIMVTPADVFAVLIEKSVAAHVLNMDHK